MRPHCSRCKQEIAPGEPFIERAPYVYHDSSLCRPAPLGGDVINHPPHYANADPTYETIKVIEAWDLGFCLGNAVKYISRAGKKGDEVEDLKKARWYLERQIARLEAQ